MGNKSESVLLHYFSQNYYPAISLTLNYFRFLNINGFCIPGNMELILSVN